MEIYVTSKTDAFIKFFVEGQSSKEVVYKPRELEEMLSYVRERLPPNIPQPFKFRYLISMRFYIRRMFPLKVCVANNSKSFTFNEIVIKQLFHIEEELYAYIQSIQNNLSELS